MAASDSTRVGTAEEGVTIERVFDAPRVLVWRAWTEPEHFVRWYGPEGMSAHTCEIDLQVGGRRLIGMQSPDGQEYYTTGVYQEIVPLERFVATESPSDADGNAVPASQFGMPEGTPMETMVTVTLEDLGGGRTKMTLNQAGFPSEDWAAGAGAGWNQAFDKLEAELATA
jgi:uncharacterized protein YndB with AHSA1/START domain